VVTHTRTRASGEPHVHRACRPMWPPSSEDTGTRAVGYIRRVEGGSSRRGGCGYVTQRTLGAPSPFFAQGNAWAKSDDSESEPYCICKGTMHSLAP
jgi:hypothetical protein